MPTHNHARVQVKTFVASEAVSNAMMRFSVSYTKAMNRRYDRVGSLFQGRFRAIYVNGDEYLVHLSRYIHLNPVMAGLAERPQDWEFSSYRDYIGIRNGTLPRPEVILSQFPSGAAYHEFIESYLPEEQGVIADLLFE